MAYEQLKKFHDIIKGEQRQDLREWGFSVRQFINNAINSKILSLEQAAEAFSCASSIFIREQREGTPTEAAKIARGIGYQEFYNCFKDIKDADFRTSLWQLLGGAPYAKIFSNIEYMKEQFQALDGINKPVFDFSDDDSFWEDVSQDNRYFKGSVKLSNSFTTSNGTDVSNLSVNNSPVLHKTDSDLLNRMHTFFSAMGLQQTSASGRQSATHLNPSQPIHHSPIKNK